MEKTLYAVHELSRFIRAVTLIRPSKWVDDVTEHLKPVAAELGLKP